MDRYILENLPFSVDRADLINRLGIDEEYIEEFDEIFDDCMRLGRPKMVYTRVDVAPLDDDRMNIGGETFTSHVLKINLEGVAAVFPYVCTSGREVYEYALTKRGDPLLRYWADSVSEMILRSGMGHARKRIEERFVTRSLYAMSPGSLPDWPMPEQRPLFRLLGDVMADIGVELTDSCLMLPVKSISGLLFESDEHYTNCKLCPRDGCESRAEAFDPAAFYEKYGLELPPEARAQGGHGMHF